MISWYGFLGRLDAILHKIRHPSHKMAWRANVDELCTGDIECSTCSICFWCRALERNQKELNDILQTNKRSQDQED